MAAKRADDRRTRFLGGVLLMCFVAAAGSQGYKQVIANDDVLRRAEATNRFVVSRTEFARRGDIVSSDGKILAQSNDTFELSLNYARVPRSKAFFMALSEASGIPAVEFSVPAYTEGKNRTWLQAISSDRADRIREVKTAWRADGLSLRRVPRRDYPFSDVTGPLIGALEEDREPTGLERSQNDVLAGRNGKLTGLVDRTGAFLPMRMKAEDQRAVHGQDLTLTIDSSLQIAAVASLRRAVEANRAKQGVAVVLEPTTGNVLAAASWVSGRKDQASQGFNPITMARFEPGSTFKILTLAEAMDETGLRGSDTVQCGGVVRVAGKDIRCAHGAHGTVDGTKAIAASCNVAAVKWAQRVGHETFIDFAKQAGLFESTDIGLPGEIRGTYNENDGSPSLQLANMGFGQAMNATPIALAAAYAALANDGVRMPPRLISQAGDFPVKPQAGRRLFSQETSEEIMRMMVATIEQDFGTAHRLRIPGYKLGGKTGTAQKLGSAASKGGMRYVSNFVGYVPAENTRAVVLVMIDEPSAGVYYGGAVAGPVFRDIAESVIRRFNLPKTE